MTFIDLLLVDLPAAKIEEIQERVDLVIHKIKFMDKPTVTCLDASGFPSFLLAEEITLAGGLVGRDVLGAVYVIFYEPGKTLTHLMREVPAILDEEWPAVKNNRIILLNDDVNRSISAENAVALVEDIAEMIHPGSFIYGHEGDKWIKFST